jgi:RNA recognition motif-containing protein
MQKAKTPTQKNKNQASRKMKYEIFVGGLSKHTTSHLLFKYFEKFGQIKKALPQRWKSGEKLCRGFAIVTCKDEQTYNKILNTAQHNFHNRNIECKPCLKKGQLQKYNAGLAQRKVFVGSIPQTFSNQDLTEIFSQVGQVEMAYIVSNKKNRNGMRIGYVTFKNEADKTEAVKRGSFKWKGAKVVCANYQNDFYEEKKKSNPTAKTKNKPQKNSKKNKGATDSSGGSPRVKQSPKNKNRFKNKKKSVESNENDELHPEFVFKFSKPGRKIWHQEFKKINFERNEQRWQNMRLNMK